MALYNVHLYREMRLLFPGIEAASAEEAAEIAAGRLTQDAATIADCDGENLAALVDVAGHDHFEDSVTLDFDRERRRNAAPALLQALTAVLPYARAEAEGLEGYRGEDEVADQQADAAWKAVEQAEAVLAGFAAPEAA